jgi:hypothetical protein
MPMRTRTVLCLCLITAAVSVLGLTPSATASLCQTIAVSTAYPHQALTKQTVSLTTTVTGSCTSDGEDYFAVRVDLVDNASSTVLSSNSTSIGYNANNFSVNVGNTAVSPQKNQTWLITVNTYLIQAGSISGKYLLNTTAIMIQIGYNPLSEFQFNGSLEAVLAVMGAVLALTVARPSKKRGRHST